MDDCIFCKIVKKEIPAKIRYEDDEVLAFDDIEPKAKYHVVIIPKKHIDSIMHATEDDAELIGKLLLAGQKIAKDLNLEQGFRLLVNYGPHAGMSVNHLHFHLLGGEELAFIGKPR